MIRQFFVSRLLTDFTQFMISEEFPLTIQADVLCGDLQSAANWIRANKIELLKKLEIHGALLLRGFPLHSAEDFDSCLKALNLENFTYAESLSNAVRNNKTERVFTANEAPPDVEIFLHHEMAQTPIYPTKLIFFCEKASEEGGATPLCQSDKLLDLLVKNVPTFVSDLEKKGVQYKNVMPASVDLKSGQGRSWRDTLGVNSQEEAEVRLASLGYGWEWLDCQNLRVTTPVLSAIRKLANGRKVFFNQLIAAYRGWKDSRNEGKNTILYGDGTNIPDAAMQVVFELSESITFDHRWREGDIVLVDNFLVMHGRRPYQGTRKVLASLSR